MSDNVIPRGTRLETGRDLVNVFIGGARLVTGRDFVNLWSRGGRMKEFDIAGEAVALILGRWTGVVREPGSGEQLLLQDPIPVAEEYCDEPAMEVCLLVGVGGNPDGSCVFQGRKGRGDSTLFPLASGQIEADERSTHLLNDELQLLLIALRSFLRFTPLDPESGIKIGVVRGGRGVRSSGPDPQLDETRLGFRVFESRSTDVLLLEFEQGFLPRAKLLVGGEIRDCLPRHTVCRNRLGQLSLGLLKRTTTPRTSLLGTGDVDSR